MRDAAAGTSRLPPTSQPGPGRLPQSPRFAAGASNRRSRCLPSAQYGAIADRAASAAREPDAELPSAGAPADLIGRRRRYRTHLLTPRCSPARGRGPATSFNSVTAFCTRCRRSAGSFSMQPAITASSAAEMGEADDSGAGGCVRILWPIPRPLRETRASRWRFHIPARRRRTRRCARPALRRVTAPGRDRPRGLPATECPRECVLRRRPELCRMGRAPHAPVPAHGSCAARSRSRWHSAESLRLTEDPLRVSPKAVRLELACLLRKSNLVSPTYDQ